MSTILIVEDHKDFRSALKYFLEASQVNADVIEASSGEEAISLAKKSQPTVILMDFSLGGMDGIEAARQIKTQTPACTILLLTVFDPQQFRPVPYKDSIKEIISKSDLFEKLIPSINKVLASKSN